LLALSDGIDLARVDAMNQAENNAPIDIHVATTVELDDIVGGKRPASEADRRRFFGHVITPEMVKEAWTQKRWG
jgi:hypothetical protein